MDYFFSTNYSFEKFNKDLINYFKKNNNKEIKVSLNNQFIKNIETFFDYLLKRDENFKVTFILNDKKHINFLFVLKLNNFFKTNCYLFNKFNVTFENIELEFAYKNFSEELFLYFLYKNKISYYIKEKPTQIIKNFIEEFKKYNFYEFDKFLEHFNKTKLFSYFNFPEEENKNVKRFVYNIYLINKKDFLEINELLDNIKFNKKLISFFSELEKLKINLLYAFGFNYKLDMEKKRYIKFRETIYIRFEHFLNFKNIYNILNKYLNFEFSEENVKAFALDVNLSNNEIDYKIYFKFDINKFDNFDNKTNLILSKTKSYIVLKFNNYGEFVEKKFEFLVNDFNKEDLSYLKNKFGELNNKKVFAIYFDKNNKFKTIKKYNY